MSSTTVNVLKLMKKYSDGYKISKKSCFEMVDRLEIFFEIHMQDIIKIAEGSGRHTVMKEDVIRYFDFDGRGDFR